MRGMPKWVVVLLTVMGIVVLGPPLLVVLLMALGVAVGISALLFKYALIAAGIYLGVMVLKAIFSGPEAKSSEARLKSSLDQLDRDDAERRALDEELQRAVAATRK